LSLPGDTREGGEVQGLPAQITPIADSIYSLKAWTKKDFEINLILALHVLKNGLA
jgi:hypothetical protein